MEECNECGKEAVGGSITGKDKSGKTKTLCWPCFNGGYRLDKKSKTNVFIKKGGA